VTPAPAFDVIAHAWTVRLQTQNDFSDGPCLQAVKMAMDWLPAVCRDGSNLMAREKMQNAATIAGLGFGNSNTGLSMRLAIRPARSSSFTRAGHRIALPYSLTYIAANPPIQGVRIRSSVLLLWPGL